MQTTMIPTHLQQLIIERIQKDGPIPFAEYMRMALYEPNYGYYMTGPARMGWEGDYYTSTDVSNFFANCMGRQLFQWWEKLGKPANFIVLEQGEGRGDLGQGVKAWASQGAPDFHAVLDYRLEDIRQGRDATALSDQHQQAATKNAPPLSSPAVILSNELLDALPVHIVEVRNAQLYEVYVDAQGGKLCEVLDEASSPEVVNYLDRYNIPWSSFGDGWRAEINLDALRWLRRTAHQIRRGFILTIDYGDKAKALYSAYRRRGTLACYFRHQMNERPLVRPGEQDITAHVNFSALISEGRRQGLRLNTFTTQQRWLEGLGISEELQRYRLNEFAEAETERASDRGQVALLKWYNLRQRVAALTDATGMGNFKVLILRR